jgi:O-antigen/teichoic acid export membrane protein
MIRKIKQKFPKGGFARSAATLMTGTVIAQAIPVAISPILTRIYSPEDFGLFALYTSIVSILSVIACGRYEQAIMLPKKDVDAVNIVALSGLVTVCISCFVFLVVFIFNKKIALLLGNPAIGLWLYLVPISMFCAGLYQALNYWFNRNKKFKELAVNRIIQSATNATVNLSFGLVVKNAMGLFFGMIFGQIIALAVLFRRFINRNKDLKQVVSFYRIRRLAKVYINFPRFDIASAFMNVLSNQAAIFFISIFFGSVQLGLFSLCMRALSLPTAFISSAVLDVFRQRASEDYIKTGNCIKIYVKILKILFLISLIPFLVLLFYGPSLFSFVFGSQWQLAGVYARIMSFLLFFRFISSPLSYVIYIAKKQHYEFIWQFVLLVLTALSMLVGKYYSSIEVALISFSACYSVMYLVYLLISFRLARGNKRSFA